MTPVCSFNPLPDHAPVFPAGTQGPPGVQGPPPPFAIGNVSTLAPGSTASVQTRVNPAGGYFLDFGIPAGLAGGLTQTTADARYALLNPTNSTYRFVTNANGTFLELWNPDTQEWHAFVVKGAAGQETIAIEPGGA